MSLEQAIKENTEVLISIRDLILSGKLDTNIPKVEVEVEVEQKTPSKPVKTVAKAKQEAPQEAKPAPTEPTKTTEPTEPTEQEVIKSFIELAKTDREAAVVVLAQFRVAKAVDVPAESRCDFLKAVKAKLVEIAGA